MKMKADLFLITALTNMHVGSGDSQYGVVDNLVQRDQVTGYPTIHASSLKGAFREYAESQMDKGAFVNHVFGPEGTKANNNNRKVGMYKFFDGNLLTLPARAREKPFVRTSCISIINKFKEDITSFCLEETSIHAAINGFNPMENRHYIANLTNNITFEDFHCAYSGNTLSHEMQQVFGNDLVLCDNNTFKELADNLPVIARNHLENGISQNLWYEEIVPRETRFYFFLLHDETHYEDFLRLVDGKVVQIGGNASIGYGYCQLKKMSRNEKA